MTKIKKMYCVHIYEKYHDYEVEAVSPAKAEELVMKREWNGDYENIDQIEVMRTCECGYDNDLKDKKCAECGLKL